MARVRPGKGSSGSSSGAGSTGGGLAHIFARIQASPSLALTVTSATSLVICYALFPLSTRAFFNRLLTGGDPARPGSSSEDEDSGARRQPQGRAKRVNQNTRFDDDYHDSSLYADRRLGAGGSRSSQRLGANNCCAVFWDVDNCAPPTGMGGRDIALAIRKAIQELTPPEVAEPIIVFRAYLELSSETAISPAQVQLRSELQGSGVSLLDTPKSGRKQVADQMMITDLLAFAIDHPAPARIVLISGDRDFAYSLGTLRNRGFYITLITPPAHVAPILEASAHEVLRWRQDVCGVDYDKDGKPYTGTRALKRAPSFSRGQNNSKTAAEPSSSAAPSTPRKTAASATTGAASAHGPLGKPVPDVFKPLVDLLEGMRKQGITRPLRSGVAAQLKQVDKDLFERAGASRWAEYAAVAEAAGIIILGTTGVSGHEWVSLAGAEEESNGRGATAPASPSMSKARAALLTPSASVNGFKAGAAPMTPSKYGIAASASYTTSSSSHATFAPAGPAKLDSPEIRPFLPLIELLNSQRSVGIPLPKITYIAKSLDRLIAQGVLDAYRQAGVTNFAQYMAAAERAGVARAQSEQVKLHPRYIGVQTTAVTPSVVRMEDTATISTASTEGPAGKKEKVLFVPPTAMGALAKANALSAAIKTKFTPGSGEKDESSNQQQALYQGLIECLREQRAAKHFYSADFFIQLVLTKLPGGERFGRNVDLFNVFLDEAERDGIVLLEPGFGHGRRHVRLAPRYVDGGESSGMGGDVLPVAGYELPPSNAAASAENGGGVAAGSGSEGGSDDRAGIDDAHVASLVPPSLLKGKLPQVNAGSSADGLAGSTSKSSTGTNASSTSSGSAQFVYPGAVTSQTDNAAAQSNTSASTLAGPSATAAGTSATSASDRARFKPLVDALVHLRREYQIVYPSMEQLHAELRERASSGSKACSLAASGLGNGGETNPHSIEFVQWLSGAADLGLVTIERYEDSSARGGAGGGEPVMKARIRLADKYVAMFKLG